MDDEFLSVELLGHRKLLQDIDAIPDEVQVILYEKAEQWAEQVYDKTMANLAERLDIKTGRLEESIDYEVHSEEGRISARVYSSGVPYAGIQERGGTTPPHMIYPVEGKVLAFIGATGDKVFATRVAHPGANIKGAHFLRDAYREVSPKITGSLYYYIVRKLRARLFRGVA